MLGDLDSGDIRPHRPVRPANLQWRIHLQVEHILMRRRANQVNHDDGLVRLANGGEVLGLEQLRERETTQRESADLDEIAPRPAIAEATVSLSEDFQHKWSFIIAETRSQNNLETGVSIQLNH